MVLACHVISQGRVSYRPAKSGGHRHCGSGDIMFYLLKTELQDPLASIRHYCLISQGHGLKVHGMSYY